MLAYSKHLLYMAVHIWKVNGKASLQISNCHLKRDNFTNLAAEIDSHDEAYQFHKNPCCQQRFKKDPQVNLKHWTLRSLTAKTCTSSSNGKITAAEKMAWLCSDKSYRLYYSPNISVVKWKRIGWARHAALIRMVSNAQWITVWKLQDTIWKTLT